MFTDRLKLHEVIMINVDRSIWGYIILLHIDLCYRTAVPKGYVGGNLLSTPHYESHGFQENRAQRIDKSLLYHSKMIVEKVFSSCISQKIKVDLSFHEFKEKRNCRKG